MATDINDTLNYLKLASAAEDYQELIFTWKAFGGKEVDNSTKIYRAGDYFIVREKDSNLNGALFYCKQTLNDQVDWTKVSVVDVEGHTVLENGITTSVFTNVSTVIFSELDVTNLLDSKDYETFTPLSKYKVDIDALPVTISDEEYATIMQIVGYPYVPEDELEYTREEVLRLAVLPALKSYYKVFPIISEEVKNVGAGQFTSIKFPEGAYGGMYWVGTGVGSGAPYMNAFGYAATEGMYSYTGYSGTKFGRGIQYRGKAVPGYTGTYGTSTNRWGDMANNFVLYNSVKNLIGRDRFTRIRHDDGFYLEGYATNGTALNITWLKVSTNWADVAYEDYDDVLTLAQANVGLLFSRLEGRIRSDSNVPFDAATLKSDCTSMRDKVLQAWSQNSYNKIYTVKRGGHAF